MKKKMLIYLVSICFSSIYHLKAQNTGVASIFNDYLKVQEKIAKNEFLINDFRLNAGNLNWNEKLQYQKAERFFYSLPPNKLPILNFLTIRIDSGRYHHQLEYMFNFQGDLVYCKEKQNNPKFHYRELVMYFENGKLIQLSEDRKIIASSNIFQIQRLDYFQKTAKFYFEKFVRDIQKAIKP